MPDGARRGQRPSVVSVAPDRTAAPEHAVHRPRDPDRESAEPTSERPRVVCFHDEMHVVALHGELDDPEITAGGDGNGLADRAEDAPCAQTPEGTTERDVRGMRRVVEGPRPVWDGRSASGTRLPSSACAAATPRGAFRE